MDHHLDEESGKSVKSLRALAAAGGECTRCPLYRDATQAVPGEGPKTADFMLVGEHPATRRTWRESLSSGRLAASLTLRSKTPALRGRTLSSPTRSSISSTRSAAKG